MKTVQQICKIVKPLADDRKPIVEVFEGDCFIRGLGFKVRLKTSLETGIYLKEFLEKGIAHEVKDVLNDVGDFASMFAYEEEANVVSKQALDAIQKAVVFSGKDVLRPALQGVMCKEGEIASTDAHTLFWYEGETGFKDAVILNKETVKILKLAKSEVLVAYPKKPKDKEALKSLLFICKEFTLEAMVIDSTFPNYRAVIPQGESLRLTFDNETMRKALTIVKEFTNSTTRKVEFHIFRDRVKLVGEDLDFELTREEEIPLIGSEGLSSKKDYFLIGFNATSFLNVLKSLPKGEVTLALTEANRAGVFNKSVLLMPVMI